MSWQDIFYSTEKFEWYGLEYFTALFFLSIVGIVLIRLGRQLDEAKKDRIPKILSFVLSGCIVIWAIIEFALDRFYVDTDLPLVFCNFFALILPVFAFKRTQRVFNILYYIILAGAVQAIITPALKFSFPHYEFLKFWTVHVGLITFVVYQMIVFKMKPTKRGIWETFLFIQIYMLIVIGINWALNSNYLYLNVRPKHDTLLSLLGGWPWYIIWMDVILIPYFFLLYLPIWLHKKSTHP